MNYKMILNTVGKILCLEAALMVPAFFISLGNEEIDSMRGLAMTIVLTAAVGVLLQCPMRGNWHTRPAPRLRDDMTYAEDPDGKPIRVYDAVDPRMILEDFYAKLALCYGEEGTV